MCKVAAGDLVSGIGGNVWFLSKDKVGRIDPRGNVSEYSVGHLHPGTPVAGSEGDLWLNGFPVLTEAQEKPSALATDPPSKILRINPHERATKICNA